MPFLKELKWVDPVLLSIVLKIGHSGPLVIYFRLFYLLRQLTICKCSENKILLAGYEPWSSGVEDDHSSNCTPITAQTHRFCSDLVDVADEQSRVAELGRDVGLHLGAEVRAGVEAGEFFPVRVDLRRVSRHPRVRSRGGRILSLGLRGSRHRHA